MDDVYPNIHVEMSQAGSGRPPAETTLLMADPGTTLDDSQLEHVSYKPQIATLVEEEMETEEEQRDVSTSGEEDGCSSAFGGLLGGFLSSVEVDFSGLPLGLTLNSVNSLLWPKPPETSLNGGFFLGRTGTEDDAEVDSPSLDLQQGEITTCDTADARLSQYTVETTVTAGYFPQVAAVDSMTHRQQGQ